MALMIETPNAVQAAGGPRRFNLTDGMTLLAATAVGLVVSRNYINSIWYYARWLPLALQGVTLTGRTNEEIITDPHLSWALPPIGYSVADMPGEVTFAYALFGRPGPELARRLLETMCLVATPLLFCWGLALGGLLARKPRPPWALMVRRPGFWPCVLPMPCIVLLFTLHFQGHVALASAVQAFAIPLAIGAVWAILVAARQWRAEASWIDRAGRAIGVAWFVTAVPALVERILN